MTAHQGDKLVKQIANVVWTGTGFRMTLKTKGRQAGVSDALQRTVKQRPVGSHQSTGQAGLVDGKTMVLAGNGNLSRA